MMKESANCVLIGKIGKPHGIGGEVKVTSFAGDTAGLLGYKAIFLSPDRKGRQKRKYQLLKGRDQGNYAIISLSGIDNRNEAEQIRDYLVWIDRDDLPELSPTEFYWHDFKGRDVRTRQGEYLGKVRKLISNGSQDILVINGESGREYMIPVCDDFVQEPDDKKGTIIVSPPDGLLEINE